MADILNIEDGVLEKCTDKSVTSVVIPESVTKIDGWAFRGCSSLTSVVIPTSVTEIGGGAFDGCESLSSVVIPSSVTEIGEYAFRGCSSLASVEIPSSVTAIGGGAFSGCTSLSSVEIPSSVTKIGRYAFEGCTSLSSVEIPSSVAEIGEYAFKDCNINELSHPCLTIKGGLVVKDSKLLYCESQSSSITIPEGVTEIGERAFSGCESLESVVIPEGVTEIGINAFRDCKSLASVEIPSSVTKIDAYAFDGCTSLSSVKFGGTVAQWEAVEGKLNLLEDIPATVVKCADGEWQPVLLVEDGVALKYLYKGATRVVIPEGVTAIGWKAFEGCESLLSVAIPSSVTEIGGCSFRGCKSLAKVTLGDDFKKVPSEWFDDINNVNPNYEILCTEGSSTYKAIKRSSKLKLHLKSLNVTKEDLELQKAKNAKIAEVQKAGVDAILPMLLEGVADSSFSLLSNTKSATVALVQIAGNNAVFKLGADSSKWLPKLQKVIEAFSDSSKSGADIFGVIKEQKMPLGEIPAKKAENTTLKADSSGSLNLFASGALRKMKYDGMKDIGLFGITEISEKVFEGCFSLSSVVIGESVTEIGWNAFGGCKSLSSVEIPSSVTKIGYDAFKDCNINELSHPCLTIKGGLVVGNSWLRYCASQSSSITIPEGVTGIEWGAFEGCSSLASVEIPPSVTEIFEYAFSGCESLASVEIPPSVTEIFEYAFSGCTSLSSVVIPSSVKEIGKQAFKGCESLTSVEFSGTVAQWEAVEKARAWHGGVPAKSVKCADGEAEL